jgi:hypothetical protein
LDFSFSSSALQGVANLPSFCPPAPNPKKKKNALAHKALEIWGKRDKKKVHENGNSSPSAVNPEIEV